MYAIITTVIRIKIYETLRKDLQQVTKEKGKI